MTREELIERLETSRDALQDVLDRLDDSQYLVPGVSGERSVKDLLAHLVMWEAQLITLLFRTEQGRKPQTAHFSAEPRAALNARWHADHRERSLEAVLEDFEGIRAQTIRRIEALSAADLANPKRHAWSGGRPLWEWILRDTVEHEAEHRAEIERWLDG